MKNYSLIAASSLSLLLFSSCEELAPLAQALSSKAKPEVTSHQIAGDAWIVDGEFDYGLQVKSQITNKGEQGDVMVNVTLSSSEGEWTRTQTINFDANETKDLSYVFTEPTVNATNVQYRVVTLP
ncbi:hypothetical protein [Roseibacillus persicicus]|uniref:hypothetical protein n=1 Tax=Roseibacillus persicicus TaxID=454148 RepID=UPI00280E1DD2|nr:hypothetical protein [Roseibacillus persicicus]MDQ8192357.1 hypothetical protein [Roseibacillus persicicus]